MTAAELTQRSRDFIFSIERAWLIFAVIFLGLALFVPSQAIASAKTVVESLLQIAPYLVLAILAAAYTSATGADQLIAKTFQGRQKLSILLAALVGALSPFCSCGVIPIIAALLAMGVPLAPIMAFWLSSPLMDPSMFIITAGEISLSFAIAKTILGAFIGLLGGFGILALSGHPILENPLRDNIGKKCCGPSDKPEAQDIVWRFWEEQARRDTFWREALKTFLFLLKWLSLAYLLESLLLAWVPAEQFAAYAGSGSVGSILLAALIGVPLYLNGYAAIPLISGMLKVGMAPGAAMAFVMGGGVSCIPAAIGVYALVKRPLFILYTIFALTGAMVAGLAYQAWVVLLS